MAWDSEHLEHHLVEESKRFEEGKALLVQLGPSEVSVFKLVCKYSLVGLRKDGNQEVEHREGREHKVSNPSSPNCINYESCLSSIFKLLPVLVGWRSEVTHTIPKVGNYVEDVPLVDAILIWTIKSHIVNVGGHRPQDHELSTEEKNYHGVEDEKVEGIH